MTKAIVSQADLTAVEQNIARQEVLVDQLAPESEQHRIAVELLLTYQDSLFVLTELRNLIADPEDGAKERW